MDELLTCTVKNSGLSDLITVAEDDDDDDGGEGNNAPPSALTSSQLWQRPQRAHLHL